MIDLFKIKEDFSFLVKEAEPWTLTQFVMWLDLKLSEFKTKGYMVLDHHTKTKPKWLEEEILRGDIVPPQASSRNNNSSPRDVGQYFSDIHAPRPIHRQSSGGSHDPSQQKSVDESDNIRGEVGIIDLSHGEIQNRAKNNNLRQNTNQNNSLTQNTGYRQLPQQNYNRRKPMPSSSVSRPPEKRSRPDVIEIDGSSPSEKMFTTTNISRVEIGRTSTPIARKAGQLLQKAKNRQSLSMGTPIYTSTSTSLTPTFSSSFNSQTTRPTPTARNRNFALGAPPVSSFGGPPVSSFGGPPVSSFGSPPVSSFGTPPVSSLGTQPPLITSSFSLSSSADAQNLDELIASVTSSVMAQASTSQQTSGNIEQQSSITTTAKRQTSFSEMDSASQQQSQTIFPGVNLSPNFSQTTDSQQAVPVALHANIDNINRELSQSGSTPSSTDGTEVKMEANPNASLSDSFNTGNNTMPSAISDISTDTSLTQSFQDTSHSSQDQVGPGGIPRPGLVDPETARAYQMVELVPGSGVYVYDKTIAQAFKVGTERETGTYSGEKMARYLLNVFWSRKDLVGATLSKAGRGKKILNQQIIEAILDFCTAHSRHSRSKVRTALHWSVSARTCQAKRKIMKLAQNLI